MSKVSKHKLKKHQPDVRAGVYFTDAKVKVATYPMQTALEEITARLTGISTEREKPVKDAQRGAISSLQEVIVTRNDAPTTLSAIKKRLDVVPQNHVGEHFVKGYECLMTQTPDMPEIRGDETLVEQWLLTLNHDKQEACREVLRGHLWTQGMQDREIFAKAETLLKPEGSAARLIHNGNPVVAVVMGAITNELQRRAKMILSENNPITDPRDNLVLFPSGLDDKQIAGLRERCMQGEGDIIEGDFKSNDATQPVELRKYESMWYRKMGAPDWYVRESLLLKEMNVFSRSLGMKFHIKGQRHSGEEAGTIGNTFNTACLSLGTLCALGVRGARCLAYGDDSLLWVPSVPKTELHRHVSVAALAKQLVASAREHGMEMEIVLPDKTQATFLQTRVHVAASGEAYPVPKLGRYLSKVNVRPNFNPSVSDDDYYAGKYLGLAHQYRFLPSISRRFLTTSQALSATPAIELKHKAWKPIQDPEVLVRSVVEATRTMSKEEEAQAFSNIYGLTHSEVTRCVDLACASQLAAACSRNPQRWGSLATVCKEVLNVTKRTRALDDLDSPAMQVLVTRDNRPPLADVSTL